MNPLAYPGLTFRQTEFCRLYALGASAQQAARRAGYSESFADHKAYRMLRTPAVQSCIKAYLEAGKVAVPQTLVSKALATLDRILSGGESEYAMVAAARLILKYNHDNIQPDFSGLHSPPFQWMPGCESTKGISEVVPEGRGGLVMNNVIGEEPNYAADLGLTSEESLELFAQQDEAYQVQGKIDPSDDTIELPLEAIPVEGKPFEIRRALSERFEDETKTPQQLAEEKEWKQEQARRQECYARTGSYYPPREELFPQEKVTAPSKPPRAKSKTKAPT